MKGQLVSLLCIALLIIGHVQASCTDPQKCHRNVMDELNARNKGLKAGCHMIGVRVKKCICDDEKDSGGENIVFALKDCRA